MSPGDFRDFFIFEKYETAIHHTFNLTILCFFTSQ